MDWVYRETSYPVRVYTSRKCRRAPNILEMSGLSTGDWFQQLIHKPHIATWSWRAVASSVGGRGSPPCDISIRINVSALAGIWLYGCCLVQSSYVLCYHIHRRAGVLYATYQHNHPKCPYITLFICMPHCFLDQLWCHPSKTSSYCSCCGYWETCNSFAWEPKVCEERL